MVTALITIRQGTVWSMQVSRRRSQRSGGEVSDTIGTGAKPNKIDWNFPNCHVNATDTE